MHAKFILIIAIYVQCEAALGQRQWVSPTTTAQELRNPYTWYRPYYQAAAEAYATYFQNARDISNQLWQKAYATGAFGNGQNNPNNPSGVPNNPSGVPNNPSGQNQNWG